MPPSGKRTIVWHPGEALGCRDMVLCFLLGRAGLRCHVINASVDVVTSTYFKLISSFFSSKLFIMMVFKVFNRKHLFLETTQYTLCTHICTSTSPPHIGGCRGWPGWSMDHPGISIWPIYHIAKKKNGKAHLSKISTQQRPPKRAPHLWFVSGRERAPVAASARCPPCSPRALTAGSPPTRQRPTSATPRCNQPVPAALPLIPSPAPLPRRPEP
jgi:hypothetical protein